MHEADICRARGWVVGDRLSGKECGVSSVIELRYIGEEIVVAKKVRRAGKVTDERECTWSLTCRDWRRVRKSSQRQGKARDE